MAKHPALNRKDEGSTPSAPANTACKHGIIGPWWDCMYCRRDKTYTPFPDESWNK